MPDGKPFVTYSRRSSNSTCNNQKIDGIRKSIAEVERKILQDISNSNYQRPNSLSGRVSVHLKSSPRASSPLPIVKPVDSSPTADPSSSINTADPSEIRIFRDVVEPLKDPLNANSSDDIWSPSKVAELSGAPAAVRSHTHRQNPIDFEICPSSLNRKVWVRLNSRPLPSTHLPDHFINSDDV